MAGRITKHWTVVETRQQSGAEAVRNVSQQGFEYYHPKYREQSSSGVRRVRALLPNYLFVRVDRRYSQWTALHSTRGVAHLFTMSGQPAFVHDDRIQYFRDSEDELGYFVVQSEEPPVFERGQLVRAERGMFQDQIGVYAGLGRGRHAARKVIYNILGVDKEFEVSAHDLVAHAAA